MNDSVTDGKVDPQVLKVAMVLIVGGLAVVLSLALPGKPRTAISDTAGPEPRDGRSNAAERTRQR